MPHSIFTGRPLPGPGEPLFTEEDTALAIALAEEEQDTCPSCGMAKSFCSDPDNQFAFEPVERMCFATWRLAQYHKSDGWTKKHDETKAATQVHAKFRDGHEPDVGAGLDLEVEGDEVPVVAGVADGA